MIRINENYTKLKASYLFADIAKRVGAYAAAHPDKKVIRLGIGDVTEPLPPVCVEALHAAADEMAPRATFKGYGPEQGYAFLREAVAQHDYAARGCRIAPDEIFISDGAKCDCGNDVHASNPFEMRGLHGPMLDGANLTAKTVM